MEIKTMRVLELDGSEVETHLENQAELIIHNGRVLKNRDGHVCAEKDQDAFSPAKWWKSYRIVTDKYSGYESQVRYIWFPFWIQVFGSNTSSSVEKARGVINSHHLVVETYM